MTGSSGGFEDLFNLGKLFDKQRDYPDQNKPQAKSTPTEKGVRMSAKTIDGVKYVRLEDLCDLLKLNGVLPNIEKKFRKSL